MKKTLISILACALMFSSCHKDDDDDDNSRGVNILSQTIDQINITINKTQNEKTTQNSATYNFVYLEDDKNKIDKINIQFKNYNNEKVTITDGLIYFNYQDDAVSVTGIEDEETYTFFKRRGEFLFYIYTPIEYENGYASRAILDTYIEFEQENGQLNTLKTKDEEYTFSYSGSPYENNANIDFFVFYELSDDLEIQQCLITESIGKRFKYLPETIVKNETEEESVWDNETNQNVKVHEVTTYRYTYSVNNNRISKITESSIRENRRVDNNQLFNTIETKTKEISISYNEN